MTYSSLSCEGASIYITHFPCKECCKLIFQSKIKRIIYLYKKKKNNDCLIFLKKLKIIINKLYYF